MEVEGLPEQWPEGVVARVNSVAPASPAAEAVGDSPWVDPMWTDNDGRIGIKRW